MRKRAFSCIFRGFSGNHTFSKLKSSEKCLLLCFRRLKHRSTRHKRTKSSGQGASRFARCWRVHGGRPLSPVKTEAEPVCHVTYSCLEGNLQVLRASEEGSRQVFIFARGAKAQLKRHSQQERKPTV